MSEAPLIEDHRSISFPCISVNQPIGEYYCGAISARDLIDMTFVDIRRVFHERDFETYLGIQRPLNDKRVSELKDYVQTVDACFPTSIILAVPSECVEFNSDKNEMTISNSLDHEDPSENVIFGQIGKALDGQHRIAGLKDLGDDHFDMTVSIFVDIDIAEQASIFATVNLMQTKVSKSLVYDLHDLANTRSPFKTAHHVAVALDSQIDGPLEKRIKRLGVATPGRYSETITQATVVESLMKYLSDNPRKDRDMYMRGKVPPRADADELEKYLCKPQVEMSAFLQSRNVRFVFMLVVDNLRLSRVSASMDGLPLV